MSKLGKLKLNICVLSLLESATLYTYTLSSLYVYRVIMGFPLEKNKYLIY